MLMVLDNNNKYNATFGAPILYTFGAPILFTTGRFRVTDDCKMQMHTINNKKAELQIGTNIGPNSRTFIIFKFK